MSTSNEHATAYTPHLFGPVPLKHHGPPIVLLLPLGCVLLLFKAASVFSFQAFIFRSLYCKPQKLPVFFFFFEQKFN
jgi:hypothetical protein